MKIDRDYLAAQLAGINQMLDRMPAEDILGRMGFESRRNTVQKQLTALEGITENRAQIALYFGGDPVIGSAGIEATFGSRVVTTFQDLITKVWGTIDGADISQMGPIKDKEQAQLHITNVVHGSFGFVLEEIDENESIFQTPLSKAADQVAEYLSTVTAENDAQFSQLIDNLNSRVFQAMREFFNYMHKGHATFRIVEGETDKQFSHTEVERAWYRVGASDVQEVSIDVTGRLLGVIPMKGRFELEPDNAAEVIEGKVSSKFSTTYLERIQNEQLAGKRWTAVITKRTVRKVAKDPTDSYTLIELHELEAEK